MKKLLLILLIIGIAVGLFFLCAYLYGVIKNLSIFSVIQAWLPFLVRHR